MNKNKIDNLPRTENALHLGIHGYTPKIGIKLINYFLKLFIKILRINGRGLVSNNFIQLLDPKKSVLFSNNAIAKNFNLTFRTGHGRLLWRVNDFYQEEPMMVAWLQGMTHDDIFLDIGSNVGMYTVPAAIVCKLTYAVELDPINLSILKHNLLLNSIQEKVVVIPLALGNEFSIEDIYYRDFSVGDALQSVGRKSPFNTVMGKSAHISKQIVLPLDELFKMYKLVQPTKIKIDVDGNELSVVKGAINVIKEAQEVYFEDSGLKDCIEVMEIFKRLGFEIEGEEIAKNSKVGRNVLLKKNK